MIRIQSTARTNPIRLASLLAMAVALLLAFSQFTSATEPPPRDGGRRGDGPPGFMRRFPPPDDGPFGGPRDPLSPEEFKAEADKAMKFVEEHFPGMHAHFSRLREREPRMFERRMRMMLPRLHRMMDVFEHDPAAGELMVREHRLDMEIRMKADQMMMADDSSDRDRLRREVRDLLVQRFEVRRQLRTIEIQRLSERLEAIKQDLSRDEHRRDEIIAREMEELELGKPPTDPR